MAGGEDLPGGRFLEDPLDRRVTGPVQVGGQTRPVQMHVGGQGRGRRPVGQAPLLLAHLHERQTLPSELRGHGELEVASGPEVLEVLVEEAVLPVIDGSSLAETVEQVVGERGRGDSHA